MTVERFRSKRDIELDDLALRLGDLMDGEPTEHALLVCASLVGFLLGEIQVTPSKRKKRVTQVLEFIQMIAERNDPPG